MKKQLLICSALALAGCSSAPDTADVEKFLEPNFASCQNIEIVDIKKTNGYEEDGYYKVEFTYNIELKDPSMLKALLKTYEQEKESKLTWLAAMAAYNKQEGPLYEEVGRLYKEYEAQGPRPNQFSNDGSDYPYGSRLQEYEMAVKQWKQLNPPPAIWQQKKDELAGTAIRRPLHLATTTTSRQDLPACRHSGGIPLPQRLPKRYLTEVHARNF